MDKNYLEIRLYYPDSEKDNIKENAEWFKDWLQDELDNVIEDVPKFTDITYTINESQ